MNCRLEGCKRVLITGVTGLLGSVLARQAAGKYSICGVARRPNAIRLPCSVERLDLTDRGMVLRIVRKVQPEVIVHAAAMTSVDQCEREPQAAFAANVDGTRYLLDAVEGTSCRFLYISTDSVFDGQKGNYSEEDAAAPVHAYGKTKLEAERLVLQRRPHSLVIRTAFYGTGTPQGAGLAEWILSTLRRGEQVPGFTDLFFSPIPATQLARRILELIEKPVSGVLHVAGSEGCSKYEFALKLASTFGFSADRIVPTESGQNNLMAPRPKNVTLRVDRGTAVLGTRMPGLEEGLRTLHAGIHS